MGFRINTNISAMNAQVNAMQNNRELSNSLSRLSSGLRINSSADDAAGMSIADSLRAQANTLGQAIKNGNDAIGVVQVADKAMDEQVKILDTIKTKAAQAAQDGQSTQSRKALQQDITKLMEELDNIANTTSYNGLNLLSGAFTNKEFQIGAYSRETIKVSIGDTTSAKIGAVRFETSKTISGSSNNQSITVQNLDGSKTTIAGVKISNSAGTGLGVLAEAINRFSELTGVKASSQVVATGTSSVAAGDVTSLTINGVTIGDVKDVKNNDSDGKLVNAINAVTDQTGVQASIDSNGRLNLTSLDGRGIVSTLSGSTSSTGFASGEGTTFGRMTFTRTGAADIVISGGTSGALSSVFNSNGSEQTVNLRSVAGKTTSAAAMAIGFAANTVMSSSIQTGGIGAGVTTRAGAMMVMEIADAAIKQLDKIRSTLGSTQNQLTATINNISVTQVNVAAAESQIRDVDFAEESSNFSKRNILAQSGSYAMSQANAVQQNVLRLLQ